LMPEFETSPDSQPCVTAFESGLKALGWASGRNLQIDYRWAKGDDERLHIEAAGLVNSTPDVLVAGACPSLVALRRATHTIPIVYIAVSMASLIRAKTPEPRAQYNPGGNAIGVVNVESINLAKWLGLLKELAPHVSRAAVIFNFSTTEGFVYGSFLRAAKVEGRRFPVEASVAPVLSLEDVDMAMTKLAQEPGAGLIVSPDPFTLQHSTPIVDLATRERLPAVFPSRSFVAAGGLASCAVSVSHMFWLAAGYVDRVLQGEEPASLPILQANKFELVINLKTAKALALDVSPSLLARADEVIE
jgi:putative tryptophan/tyrosine transport system substrate-binding protein